MLREQVLVEWNNCKETIIKNLTQLKEQVKQATNPEIKKLEEQVLAKMEEIRTKRQEIEKAPKDDDNSHFGFDPGNFGPEIEEVE